jgi:hypothetical protein
MKKKSLIAVLKDYFSGQPEEEKKPETKPVTTPKPNTWGSSGRIAQMRNGTLMQQRIPTLDGNPLNSNKKLSP